MSVPLCTVRGVRLLHTSDWHLGRLMDKASLLDEQAGRLDRIVELGRDAAGGARGDRRRPLRPGHPAAPTRSRCSTTRSCACATPARTVVAISGNHDSSVRVGFGDRLLPQPASPSAATCAAVGRAGRARRSTTAARRSPSTRSPTSIRSPSPTSMRRRAIRGRRRRASGAPAMPALGALAPAHRAMAWALDRVRADLRPVAARALGRRGPHLRQRRRRHVGLRARAHRRQRRPRRAPPVRRLRLRRPGPPAPAPVVGRRPRRLLGLARCPTRSPRSTTPSRCASSTSPPTAPSTVKVEPLGVGPAAAHPHGRARARCCATPRSTAPTAAGAGGAHRSPPAVAGDGRLRPRFPHAVELRHRPAGSRPMPSRRPPRPSARVRRADPLDAVGRFLAEQRRGSRPTPPSARCSPRPSPPHRAVADEAGPAHRSRARPLRRSRSGRLRRPRATTACSSSTGHRGGQDVPARRASASPSTARSAAAER